MIIYYMASKLGATISLQKVRLGVYENTYSIQLRVVNPSPLHIEEDIYDFVKERNYMQAARLSYNPSQFNHNCQSSNGLAEEFSQMSIDEIDQNAKFETEANGNC